MGGSVQVENGDKSFSKKKKFMHNNKVPNNLFIFSVMFGSLNNNNLRSGITLNNSSDEKFQRTDNMGEFFESMIQSSLDNSKDILYNHP